MKTSAFIAFLLAAYPLFSGTYNTYPETLECRKYIARFSPELSAAQLVAQDLLNGSWSQDSPQGATFRFQFYPNGTALRLTQDATGNLTAGYLAWQVENWDGRPVLTLQEQGSPIIASMLVEQNCNGVVLTELHGANRLSLAYSPLPDNAELESIRASLEGDWTNVTWSEEDNSCGNLENGAGSFLHFRFHPDGTYHMACGNANANVEEAGTWDLSKDGRFIFFRQPNQPPRVAKIASMDEHGLVLEHSMNAPGFSSFFCSNMKSFTFIR